MYQFQPQQNSFLPQFSGVPFQTPLTPLANSFSASQPDPCNLIVNYIPTSVTDDELKKLFSQFGEIDSARVILDKKTGHPKGYGFVKFVLPCSAKLAKERMNGYELQNKRLKVTQAKGPQSHHINNYCNKVSTIQEQMKVGNLISYSSMPQFSVAQSNSQYLPIMSVINQPQTMVMLPSNNNNMSTNLININNNNGNNTSSSLINNNLQSPAENSANQLFNVSSPQSNLCFSLNPSLSNQLPFFNNIVPANNNALMVQNIDPMFADSFGLTLVNTFSSCTSFDPTFNFNPPNINSNDDLSSFKN